MYTRSSRRGIRRHYRAAKVAKTFNMLYVQWGWGDHWNSRVFAGYEKVVGADRFECQDSNRHRVWASALKLADNRCMCSCSICRQHKVDVKRRRRIVNRIELPENAHDVFEVAESR
jgi:hypothetical protein